MVRTFIRGLTNRQLDEKVDKTNPSTKEEALEMAVYNMTWHDREMLLRAGTLPDSVCRTIGPYTHLMPQPGAPVVPINLNPPVSFVGQEATPAQALVMAGAPAGGVNVVHLMGWCPALARPLSRPGHQ